MVASLGKGRLRGREGGRNVLVCGGGGERAGGRWEGVVFRTRERASPGGKEEVEDRT